MGAVVSADVTVEGDNNGPLSIKVGLDRETRYYLKKPLIDLPGPGFVSTTVSGLVEFLEVEFDGRVEGILKAEVPLVGMSATFNVTVARVDALFRGNKTGNLFASVTDFVRPSIAIPSLIDILLADPDALVSGLDSVFELAEAASLGPNGIVTNFPAPFISEKLGSALGAGTKDNVLAQARSAVTPKLKAQLEGFEGASDTVADVLARVIENVLRPRSDFIGLIREEDSVVTTCFEYNNTRKEQVGKACGDGGINTTSIMWTIRK